MESLFICACIEKYLKTLPQISDLRVCARCKEHGVTVQAAISAASMLTMARAQARNHPLPQNILMQAPIDMRSQARSFFLPLSSFT